MRREKEVRIEPPVDGSENRDAGKVFLITELSAADGEAWGLRAMGAMMRAGLPVSDEMMAGGLAAFAVFGLKALLMAPFEETKPLFDQMMGCVQIKEPLLVRALLPTDIEEIGTRIRLRDEVIALHLGFSLAVVMLTAAKATAQALAEASSATRTSTGRSGRSSRRASPRSKTSKRRLGPKT